MKQYTEQLKAEQRGEMSNLKWGFDRVERGLLKFKNLKGDFYREILVESLLYSMCTTCSTKNVYCNL